MSSGTASREFGKVPVLLGRGRHGTAERQVREDEAAVNSLAYAIAWKAHE